MAKQLVIEKPVSAPTVVQDGEVVEVTKLVDRLGEIEKRKEAIEVLIAKKTQALLVERASLRAEAEEIQKNLVAAVAPKLLPQEEAVLEGVRFRVKIGKIGRFREVFDKAKLWAALEKAQKGLAMALAEFKLGDVDKYVSEHDQKAFVRWENNPKGDACRKVSVEEKQ